MHKLLNEHRWKYCKKDPNSFIVYCRCLICGKKRRVSMLELVSQNCLLVFRGRINKLLNSKSPLTYVKECW